MSYFSKGQKWKGHDFDYTQRSDDNVTTQLRIPIYLSNCFLYDICFPLIISFIDWGRKIRKKNTGAIKENSLI